MPQSTRSRRGTAPKLTDEGLAVFRYDKRPDGTGARFVFARPDTEGFALFANDPGWYQVDPKERRDHEAAETAAQDKQDAFAEQERRQSTRYGQLSSLTGRRAERGGASEQEALAERDAAVAAVAERDKEIEALRRQLAERDAVTGAKTGKAEETA